MEWWSPRAGPVDDLLDGPEGLVPACPVEVVRRQGPRRGRQSGVGEEYLEDSLRYTGAFSRSRKASRSPPPAAVGPQGPPVLFMGAAPAPVPVWVSSCVRKRRRSAMSLASPSSNGASAPSPSLRWRRRTPPRPSRRSTAACRSRSSTSRSRGRPIGTYVPGSSISAHARPIPAVYPDLQSGSASPPSENRKTLTVSGAIPDRVGSRIGIRRSDGLAGTDSTITATSRPPSVRSARGLATTSSFVGRAWRLLADRDQLREDGLPSQRALTGTSSRLRLLPDQREAGRQIAAVRPAARMVETRQAAAMNPAPTADRLPCVDEQANRPASRVGGPNLRVSPRYLPVSQVRGRESPSILRTGRIRGPWRSCLLPSARRRLHREEADPEQRQHRPEIITRAENRSMTPAGSDAIVVTRARMTARHPPPPRRTRFPRRSG
jgi:hypothetical protein